MSESIVTSSDVAPVKVPTSFKDLKKPELLLAADFFGTETEGGVEALRADLVDNGVTFDDYLEHFHPEVANAEPVSQKFAMPEPVDVESWPDADEGGEDVTSPVTATAVPTLAPAEKYLIKFIGENPYFEFGRYKFTTEKPYGIMPAAHAQDALVNEPTKFRQAFPDELQEFYG